MARDYSAKALHAAATGAMTLAAHGTFWTGTQRRVGPGGTIAIGQACVEYFVPEDLRHDHPLVLIHGGGQGTDFINRADGSSGWLHDFVGAGFAVYVIDLPGHGRSPGHPDQIGATTPPPTYEMAQAMFTHPETNPHAWPQAKQHTQWPTNTEALDSFMASSGPHPLDLASAQSSGQAAVAALCDLLGPSVLVTHSSGGPIGWLAADARPGLVAGIVAVEPLGPPVTGMGPMALPWGLTAAPMRYDPPVAVVDELAFEPREPAEEGALPCMVQREPARRLLGLAGVPVLVVSAEASWTALTGQGVVDYLVQAGVEAEHLRLGDIGISGNGHLMMLEENAGAISAKITAWIERLTG
jgi:pimeloyl-ACP methyl ester carboxylesterase